MNENNVEIIYENKDIIVVNKPAGLLVHGIAGKVSDEPTLTDILLKKYPEIRTVGDEPALRPGVVHRLDKDTSGVMVIARNQPSFEYLKSLFKGRNLKKTYIAIVAGIPKERTGIIDRPIGIKSGTTKRSVESKKMAKPAVTEYEVLKIAQATDAHGKENSFAMLSVSPKTGRTHQIRVHLTSIGHPIVGDALYGPKKQPPWASRLMLHAASIEFSDGSGGRLRFDAEVPKEFEKIFKK